MKLRDHPLMVRKSGFSSWPPHWRPVEPHWGEIQGEIGLLEYASMNDLIPNKIFVAMRHLSERYIAVLAFDDEMFAKQVYPLLTNNIERSIHEIGDLDVSHLL